MTTYYNLISANANLGAAQVKARSAGGSQNHVVRAWIITMLLVLAGLSSLKLR